MKFENNNFKLFDDIKDFGIRDPITIKVKEFYEEYPFPNYKVDDNKYTLSQAGDKNSFSKKLKDFIGFDKSKIKVQLHSTNEWINSLDLGYSSLNNISNDGSLKFQGDYNQSLKNKLFYLLINIPKIIRYKFNNLDNSNFETLYLDINFKNFDKILDDRRKVMFQGNAIDYEFNKIHIYYFYFSIRKI